MDWAEGLAEIFEKASDKIGEMEHTFDEDASEFENILIQRGGPMIHPKLRKTTKKASEYDMSTERGRFLLQREAMFFEALEGK